MSNLDKGALHIPVLLEEVVEVLQPADGKVILDGTFGRGGHSRRLLEAGAEIIGLDQDPEAIAFGEQLKSKVLTAEQQGRLELHRLNFREMSEALKNRENEEQCLDGILLDLGVSSPQIDQAARGFSFQEDGPLDMRMDPEGPLTAADVVNDWDESQLRHIFKVYGEERQAGRAARAICLRRDEEPFERTLDLAAVVEKALGGRRGRTHPATKVFQAIRIAVNQEMEALEESLEQVPTLLRPNGRLTVITFHSLEDRVVKDFFTRWTMEEIRGEGVAFGQPNPEFCMKKLGRWLPSAEEVEQNPRARSSKLRAVERLVGHES